jgi:O-antigen ligase
MIVLGRPNDLTAMAVQGRYGLWVALVYAGVLLIALRLRGVQELSRRPMVSVIAVVAAIALLVEQVMVGSFYVERANNMQAAVEYLRAGDRSDAALDTVKSLIPASRPAFDLYAARGLYGFSHTGR